jgi:hypothetical protein
MVLQIQVRKAKSVKILPMERQNAKNVAPAIVMDVIAENATPTATVTAMATPLKICKLIKLRKK